MKRIPELRLLHIGDVSHSLRVLLVLVALAMACGCHACTGQHKTWNADPGVTVGGDTNYYGIHVTINAPRLDCPGVCAGSTIQLSVDAWDKDAWRYGPSDSWHAADDSIKSITWTCSDGSVSGAASASWTAPSTPGTYTLTCKVDDQGDPPVPPDEGNRDDGYLEASFSVTVIDGCPSPAATVSCIKQSPVPGDLEPGVLGTTSQADDYPKCEYAACYDCSGGWKVYVTALTEGIQVVLDFDGTVNADSVRTCDSVAGLQCEVQKIDGNAPPECDGNNVVSQQCILEHEQKHQDQLCLIFSLLQDDFLSRMANTTTSATPPICDAASARSALASAVQDGLDDLGTAVNDYMDLVREDAEAEAYAEEKSCMNDLISDICGELNGSCPDCP